MCDIYKLIEKGYDNERSVKMAIHKDLYQFEAMWDIDGYESDEDEMYDDDVIKDDEYL
jgi:hypothetical protein